MGLLRACADAVVIGAGTLRASPATTGLPNTSTRPLPLTSPNCATGETAPHTRLAGSSLPSSSSTRRSRSTRPLTGFCTGWSRTFTDPRLCAAIVDRLTFNASIIETGTESYRPARSKAQKNKAAG
jgi:hypothetical protein